ncbi:MAG: right-handed parallel beta-helix repeat-containing protein [Bacteroidales bacterium]|jgi:hypothetical protein|nr:right-handed parallel beta-helix repeat-containing protein [Bacteroidales bacterium]
MKRILLLSVLAVIQFLPVTAQFLGDGSMGNPYRGTLAGAFTISGTKYFTGTIIIDNEQLTIAPGTILIAATGTSGILVNGTGQLNAQGTSSSRILITSNSDLDGTYGEPTDTWGNITLISSGVSNISYCTIENGRRLATRIGYYGGGLYLGTSSVTVTSTTIRNCIAGYGGAIIVAGTTSPVISGCIITGNSAIEQGGAIYVAGGSSPVITNTIIYSNSSLSTTRSGGSVASIASSPKIINTTIAYSSSPAAGGKSVYLENSPDARIINTIIWGSSDNIGLSGTPSSVIEYCAIEGTSLAGCLTLNSSNTDPEGPNFTNPGSGDFTIAFISPCRDSGTDSYPGVTVPLTDYAGGQRIGQTDIGAYEIRYSRWVGRTTDWTRPLGWDKGVRPGTTDVIIPAGVATYPTVAPGPSFTLNAGLTMIIEPGARVTLSSLTNNGTLVLRADANAYATLITGSYSGAGGNANVDLFLTSGPTGEWWHYIASPATVSKTAFTDIEPELLVRYDESKVLTDVSDGWQWHDGYGGTTPFSNLNAKEGYDVSVASDVIMTYRNLKSLTTSMGRIDLPFSGSGGDTTVFGYSLLGNSLTCGINWDLVTYSHEHKLIRHAYYLRTASGEEASYVNGVGTNGATAHIAPLQGFFVRTRATGTYITIPDNAREHTAAPRFKSAEQIPLIRLQFSSSTQTDETVVRFDPEATTGFDGLLDASKPFSHVKGHIKIYSETGGENYSINAIPWPTQKTSIPLTLGIHEAGTYKISGSQFQTFAGYTVVLTDRLTGSRTGLDGKAGYSFQAAEGTISGRFTLDIIPAEKKAIAAGEENKPEVIQETSLRIYSAPGRVCILPQGSGWDGTAGKVRIFDITGRVVFMSDNERLYSGELKEFQAPGNGGLLIVEVVTGQKRYLEKIVLAR